MIRDHVRRYLGTKAISNHLANLEENMAKVIDLLNGLVAQQTAASAAQATSFSNLHNAIDRLETAVRDGEASPEVEAAVNDLRAGFDSLQQAANDADNGFEPVETPTGPVDPNAPVVETPTDADGDVIADVPAENGTSRR